MSIAKVQKIQLLAYTDACMELLAALQEEGLIHIQKTDVDEAGLDVPELDVSEQDHWLYKLKQAIDYLSQWQEKSLGQKLSGQKPEVITRARNTILEMDYPSILTEVERLESQENENLNRIRFLEKEKEVLSPLEGLELPMLRILPTDTTQIRIGSVPTTRLPELLALSDTEPVCADVIHQDKRQAQVWLLLWEKDVERMDAALRELNFNPQHFSEAVLSLAREQDRVSDIIVRISQQVADAQLKVKELQEQGRSLATKELDNLKRVYDVLFNERQKVCSHGLLGLTGSVYFLEGWIQEENVSRLESRLEPYSNSVEYYLRDPEPNEEFPIALKNRKIWRPFELITKLYGLPQGGTLDPTVSLAPFFFIFVGLTVSEAGYGLLVSLLCLLFLKLAKPKGGLKQFLVLMTILGVANVIIGTLVGGWFGFPIRRLLLLDPLEDPVRFLLLALVLGFIQVWFGTFLNFSVPDQEQTGFPGGGSSRMAAPASRAGRLWCNQTGSGWLDRLGRCRLHRVVLIVQPQSGCPVFRGPIWSVRHIRLSVRYSILFPVVGPGAGHQCYCYGGQYIVSDSPGYPRGRLADRGFDFCRRASFQSGDQFSGRIRALHAAAVRGVFQ